MTDHSIKFSHWSKFINFFETFSLHEQTTLHYYWPFETQDDCNVWVLSLATYPRYNDIHPCMYSYSWISNVTNPCLEHLKLVAACCKALVAAAQHWQRQQSGPAGCSNAGGPRGIWTRVTDAPLSFRAQWQPIWSRRWCRSRCQNADRDGNAGTRLDALAADQTKYPIGYPIG